MKLYAIRHIPTGNYLPYRKSRKGFTADEPIANCIPRLFKKKQHATVALNCWLEGKWGVIYGDTDYVIEVQKQHNRKASSMEIVAMNLTEVKTYDTKTI